MAHILVVASRRFNPHELWVALEILQSRGHTYEVVSTDLVLSDEESGKRFGVKRTQDDIHDLSGFNGLVYVSGHPEDTQGNWQSIQIAHITQMAVDASIPIAAICGAVPLARAAVKGKRVSCFPLLKEHELLRNAGALIQNVAVTVDGLLVTAENTMAAQLWIEAFCDVLETGTSSLSLRESGMIPGRRERRPIPEVENLKEIMKRTGKKSFKE